jgi:hypothetical protein
MDLIIAAAIAALASIATVIIRAKMDRAQRPCKLQKHTVQNEDVYKALEFMLSNLNADRVVVYEFHNGDVYYSGSSQQKFSNTYEVLAEGISSEIRKQQNLRVSSFNRFVKPLIDNDIYDYAEISKIDNVGVKEFFEDQGTKSTFCVPIRLLTGNIIGILGVDYVKQSTFLTKDQLHFIKNQATIISGYLKD